MNPKYTRNFTVSPPSTLLLNWLFEFHCTIQTHRTQGIVVDVQEATIGSVQIKMKNPGANWKIWLYVWEKCHILALNHAFDQNTRDAAHAFLFHPERLADQE